MENKPAPPLAKARLPHGSGPTPLLIACLMSLPVALAALAALTHRK